MSDTIKGYIEHPITSMEQLNALPHDALVLCFQLDRSGARYLDLTEIILWDEEYGWYESDDGVMRPIASSWFGLGCEFIYFEPHEFREQSVCNTREFAHTYCPYCPRTPHQHHDHYSAAYRYDYEENDR